MCIRTAAPHDGDNHPFPDLAVLRVQEGPADHPCVRFAEDEPAPGLMVLAAGFSAPALLRTGGEDTERAEHELRQLAADDG